MARRRRSGSPDRPSAGDSGTPAEEFVEVELEDVVARTAAHLTELIDRAHDDLERELGSFEITHLDGQMHLAVGGVLRYQVSTTRGGRLLLTDVSGRFEPHL